VLWGLSAASANVVGTTVIYSNIDESSSTDATPLYYTPVASGDTLNFDPVFTAFADGSSGNASEMTIGRLSFDIHASIGNIINGLQFVERGNYSLLSFGNAALADVSATFFIEILEVDGIALHTPVNEEATMIFSPNADGQFLYNTFGISNGPWTGNVGLDLDVLLSASGISYSNGITKLHVELDNTLLALTQTDSQAHITIQDFQVVSTTSSIASIPEQASLVMLSGMGSVLLFIRRYLIV
jgi:hypothetical protein